MADEYDVIGLIMAYYKDAVEKQELERIKNEFEELRKAEVESRRIKAKADINQMADLNIALNRFDYTYRQLVSKTNTSIPEIETYLKSISKRIKLLSYQKNK